MTALLTATAQLTVSARTSLADDVVGLDLTGPDLPGWAPGAHVGVEVDGVRRHYSLCGDPADRDRYRIAVLRQGAVSAALHALGPGDTVAVSGPHNAFALVPAARYLFVAGGIGITPLLPMLGAVAAPWELHYAGRARSAMAFADELAGARNVHLHAGVRPDLGALVSGCPADTAVYVCGPAGMVAAVEAAAGGRGVYRESFLPVVVEGEERPVEVTFARSGITVVVPPGRSVLQAGEDAGADVFGSCYEGICGTCETRVLEGRPEHRDALLTGDPADTMLPCVSRARTDRLVLDA